MELKVNILYDIGNETGLEICGFVNIVTLGVCLTNSIFSQIISSELLMSKVTNLMTKNGTLIRQLVKAVEEDPNAYCIHPHELVGTGDLLRHNLIEATKGRECDYRYGLAGEYYLLKHYFQLLSTRQMRINKTHNSKRAFGEMETSCAQNIRKTKLISTRISSLNLILKDLFDSIHFQSTMFDLDIKEMAVYHSEINFLSIEQKMPHPHFHQYSTLSSNLFTFLNEYAYEHLKRRFFYHKSSAPDHIMIDYGMEYLKYELHPKTFGSFYAFLDTYNLARMRGSPFLQYSFDDVMLAYGSVGWMLPKDFSPNFVRQKFVVEFHNYIFDVKSISFILLKHYEISLRMVKQHNFQYYMSNQNKYVGTEFVESPYIKTCYSNLYYMLMDYMVNVTKYSDMDILSNILGNEIMSNLQEICRYEYRYFSSMTSPGDQECHYFTVARRNNKWIIIHDSFISEILDFTLFYKAFKFEHVVSIWLDKVNYKV
ncbi:hypothetical protein SNEBB_011161 [Seison nebaliae]|nr:hypothetical protein SNEBB_011161 [Seison nebaliae]